MFLWYLLWWPSADLLAEFCRDLPRGIPPSGVTRKRDSQIHRCWTCQRLYLGNGARHSLVYNYWLIRNPMAPLWPFRMTPNKGSGPQFGKTVCISGVNKAEKVKSDAQVHVTMNQNLNPAQIFFRVAERTVLPTIFTNFWNCPKRVQLGSQQPQIWSYPVDGI